MRIELDNIHKTYGPVRANEGVSLTVASGTICGLLGENGAGKTTLMKVLSGYQPADAGRILLDGHEVVFSSPAEAIAAGIGMLHQDPLDVPAMTVLDNFSLGRGSNLAHGRLQGRRELLGLCHQFGFTLAPEARVASLTVGERQQLEIVRLLSLGVRVIILDEPTTGISAPQRVLLFELLHQLVAQGLTVIFVSHKLDEVRQLCSEVVVLRQGKVAGRASAPLVTDQLVEMMFGQCLSRYTQEEVAPGEIVLQLDEVGVHTYRLNVGPISLEIRAGEVVGFAGLEGSGQRATMQACAGLERIASGHLFVSGQEMTNQPYRRFLEAGVAFVPAARLEEGLVSGLTLREHAALTEEAEGLFVRWPRAEARAQEMVHDFNIIGRPESQVQQLSGGNQQRAILALLPEETRLLILEHPTRGLDVESSRWVWNRLLERRQRGAAVLFTSTDLDELVENSNRILVFSGGNTSSPLGTDQITCEELGYLIGGRGL